MAAVPQRTTVPTAAATSCDSAWTTGCVAATAEQPQIAAPVEISTCWPSVKAEDLGAEEGAEWKSGAEGEQIREQTCCADAGNMCAVSFTP